MNISTRTRTSGAIGAALIVLAGLAAPAEAQQDPGTIRTASTSRPDSTNCPLTRVLAQYVRCDLLTGAGVPAASWVPQR